jgi:DtxR family Mn-dependent transcriptional regulator
MTKSEEDYIKFLYQPTSGEREVIKISTIAKAFGYTEQSVNEMMKRLSDKNLIDYIPYKGVYLTPVGHQLALKMIRSHRIWEVFLYDKLGYGWDEVHALSEIIEHTHRDDVVDRLYTYLNSPSTCPHGNPIPSNEHQDFERHPNDIALQDTSNGQTFLVQRVEDSPSLLTYLTSIGVKLGSKITIEHVDALNDVVHISIEKQTFTIGFKNASKIFGIIV